MCDVLDQLKQFEEEIGRLRTERNRVTREIRKLSHRAAKVGELILCSDCFCYGVRYPDGSLTPGWRRDYIDGNVYQHWCPQHHPEDDA